MARYTDNAVVVERVAAGKREAVKDERFKKMAVQHRTVEYARDDAGLVITDKNGRYSVCISSEAPVDRWFGAEILDHTKASIDLSRFERGIPLLVNHDTDDQVGVIEDPEIGQDRKLRGWARFGRSARAQEIKQDVDDGIRRDMSVGYRIKKMVMEESDDESGETYRATLWQPMEGSLVPVPADIEVGVGRSADDALAPIGAPQRVIVEVIGAGRSGVESALPVATQALAAAAPVQGAQQEVRSMAEANAALTGANGNGGGAAPAVQVVDRGAEMKEINALVAAHAGKLPGLREKADKWVAEDRSVDFVSRQIMDEYRDKAIATATASAGPLVDLSARDQRRYSVCRAVIAAADKDWGKAPFEREVSLAIGARLEKMGVQGRSNGFWVPTTLDAGVPAEQTRATLAATTSSLGGAAVFTEPMGFIELLRNLMTVKALGARMLTGLTAPVAFPRQKTAATASWSSEAPGSAVSASNQTFDQLTLNPTALQSVIAYSRQLMLQATPDIDAIVRQDIALIHALAIDLAAIQGTGSTQPTGITATAGIGSVTVGANGGVPAYTQILQLEKTVEVANALRGSLGYLTTPGVKLDLRNTTKLTNTIGLPIWEGGQPGNINGYPAYATNQVPSNLTKGTSTTVCHAAIFGNFQELMIGEFGAFEILTDPYTLADKNSIRLVSFQLADVGVRHAASFAADLDFLP